MHLSMLEDLLIGVYQTEVVPLSYLWLVRNWRSLTSLLNIIVRTASFDLVIISQTNGPALTKGQNRIADSSSRTTGTS